jgi:hypothetical protein
LAGYDGDLPSPQAEVVVEIDPSTDRTGVEAAGSLLRSVAAWDSVDDEVGELVTAQPDVAAVGPCQPWSSQLVVPSGPLRSKVA